MQTYACSKISNQNSKDGKAGGKTHKESNKTPILNMTTEFLLDFEVPKEMYCSFNGTAIY